MYRAFTAIELAATEIGDAMLVLMGARPKPVEHVNVENNIERDSFGGNAELSRIQHFINSHEAKSERLEYGKMKPRLPFVDWTAGPNIGIAQMRDYLRIIERDKPNPFHPDLMGRTRFVCVVPDEDYPRRRPTSVWARVEAEFIAYHYAQLKSGEPTSSELPAAYFNDYMDMIKAAAFDAFPRPKRLSDQEELEEKLDPVIRIENVPKLSEEDQGRAFFSRDLWTKELQRRDVEERAATGTRGRFGGIRVPTRPRLRVVKR
jgi:hypothetical protein